MTIRSYIARQYVIIPFFYLLVIILLFFLQFSEKLNVQEQFNSLSFTGKFKSSEDRTLRTAEVVFNGLKVGFSEQKALLIEQNNETKSINLLRYQIPETEEKKNSLILFFDHDINIEFSIDSNSENNLHIFLTVPQDIGNITTLSLPYAFLPSVELASSSARAEAVTLRFKNEMYTLLLPTGSTTDSGYISMPISFGTCTIRYTTLQTQTARIDPEEFTNTMSEISRSDRDERIQEYINQAYSAWKDTRYNGGTGTWNMYNAPPRFSEDILIAFLAEAWRRGEYPSARQQMLRAASLHPDAVGFRSAPFLGNLEEISKEYLLEDQQREADLLQKIQKGNTDIFLDHQIIEHIQMRGSNTVFQALLEFLPIIDYHEASILSAIGMLHAYTREYADINISRLLQHFRAVVEELLIPHILKIGDGIFLETSASEINIRYSLHAGLLIEEIGMREKRYDLQQIGRWLIISVLDIVDEGFIPAALFINKRTAEPSRQVLGPEMLYDLLHNNPQYPRYTSLKEILGHGAWIWSITNITLTHADENEITFTLNTEPDYTHYIILNNIPEFSSMVLFNLIWRNDPKFEYYARGRNYDPNTKVLMIKYNDISPQNTMSLLYAPPE